jgi:hypothetical protein
LNSAPSATRWTKPSIASGDIAATFGATLGDLAFGVAEDFDDELASEHAPDCLLVGSAIVETCSPGGLRQ